jgi:hypothetical protein
MACPADQFCSAGTCELECASYLTECGGLCFDTRSDSENCGMCGNACPAGEVCSAGTCETSCGANLTQCGAECIDTESDPNNCGGCANPCLADQFCSAGVCALECASYLTECAGVCRDTSADAQNCGTCGNACDAGQVCLGGTCEVSCGGDLVECPDGACHDPEVDSLNCGACGNACASGEVCLGSACEVSCGTNLVECGGACTDTAFDPNNCGGCGVACGAGETCWDGVCGDQRCPAGEAMVGINGDGSPDCAPLAPAITDYANSSCRVYFGWRDDCDNCTQGPNKWGYAGGNTCHNGSGGDNTCTTPSFDGGPNVNLFGLNTDGTVNDDDTFYAGLRCDAPTGTTLATNACPAGRFVVGYSGGQLLCAPIGVPAASSANSLCSLYFGWRDQCDGTGCNTPPSDWGRTSATTCAIGGGSKNHCYLSNLGGTMVRLIGVDIGGDVDGNDRFYLGLRCEGALPSESRTAGACPAGQMAVGVASGGGLLCASPSVEVEDTVNSSCDVYLGHRDSCNGCTNPPTRWGRTNGVGTCTSLGPEGICRTFTLDDRPVRFYGVNTDGGVNGDDKFYAGMRCD